MSEFNPYKNRDFYQKFVECNVTFNVNLENIKTMEKPVLLFGTSKAGKSTLVARLLSTSDRREFLDEIKSIQKTRENRRIEGIEIGGEAGSCTLIPTPLPLPDSGASKGLQMVDLPGFKDSDPMRDILISLFHKCTLSELLKSNKTPKIIVVIDATLLFNFPAIANQYHIPLQELFGDSSSGNGYSTFIDHMRFVFTHMDGFYAHNEYETGDQPSDIVQKALINISNNASDLNMVKLLGRMLTRRYHTCINYAEDDRDACIAKINALLADNKTESGLPPARMSIFETNGDRPVASEFEDATEEELLKRMQEMTDMNWNNRHVPDEAVLGSVGEYMLPNLQSMDCGVGDITDEALIAIASGNAPNLRSLNLEQCNSITDSGLTALANGKLLNLESLNISYCIEISDLGVTALANGNLSNLQSLNIESIMDVSDSGVAAIANGNLTNLQSLNMRLCMDVTDSGLTALANGNLTNLQSLDISGCEGITDSGLTALANGNLGNLQLLKVYNCESVTEEGLNAIREAYPKLELVTEESE